MDINDIKVDSDNYYCCAAKLVIVKSLLRALPVFNREAINMVLRKTPSV